jgi:heat shock protein HtpX
VDNPREGFSDIFATHPTVESRVDALVKFAGGHDPGPIALPMPHDMQDDDSDDDEADSDDSPRPQIPPPAQEKPKGPWGPKPGGPWGG